MATKLQPEGAIKYPSTKAAWADKTTSGLRRTSGLERTQVTSKKERREVMVARNWIEAKDTKMVSGKMLSTYHIVSVSPEWDQQREKLGKMAAAIVAGTKTAECEFHVEAISC